MTSAAQSARARAEKALDRLTKQTKEDGGYATGRQNAVGWKGPDLDINSVMKGVTVGWLAQAFNFNHDQVKKKLRSCPPLHRKKEGFIYDLRMAVPYLVKPQFDIDEYLRNASISDLPLRFQTEYWQAKNKRLEYEEKSAQLWRTEQVFEVLGSIFQTMKTSMQLWTSNLERTSGLNELQRKTLTAMVDGLQDQIHSEIVEMAKKPKTRSVMHEDLEHERAEAEAKAMRERIRQMEEDDEEVDIASII